MKFPDIPFLSLLKYGDSIDKSMYYLALIVIPLPFILPQSDILTSSAIFQYMARLVPAAHKLSAVSAVSAYPNVYEAYIVFTGYLAFFVGTFNTPSYFKNRKEVIIERNFSASAGVFRRAIQLLRFMIIVFGIGLATLYLFYVYPMRVHDVTSVADAHTRGQLMFNAMFGSRFGLLTFGTLIPICIAMIWCGLLTCTLIVFTRLTPLSYLTRKLK